MDSSTMALCGSTLFDNESVTGIRKPYSFPCPCIKNFGLLHHCYSSVLKKAICLLVVFSQVCQTQDSRVAVVVKGSVDEQTIERDLEITIAEEDYTKAAEIRDNLKALQEDSKSSVFTANSRFYDAFRAGDLATMQVLWARGDDVCCVYPGVKAISVYDDAMMSWDYVWANYEFPIEIQTEEVKVHVRGNVGYVTCLELVKTKGRSWRGQFVSASIMLLI